MFFLIFPDTDLRRALDIAHWDRHCVGYAAICWFVFQDVSTLRKGRDSAYEQWVGLISLEYSPVLIFFRDTDLRPALDIAHRDRYRVGYLTICWFVFQGVSKPC